MKEFIWKHIARFLARPTIAWWLIQYAMRTPYSHLPSNEDPSYMGRFWLFNPYTKKKTLISWIPFSIRIHHIKRADAERHPHDHPWDARTIILIGYYEEYRLGDRFTHLRGPGDTATLGFNQYHSITRVSTHGVWTLFISWRYQGVWGFMKDGKKIPHDEYLNGSE